MNRLIVTIVSFTIASVSQVASAGEQVDYVAEIKPILAARCYPCHSALRQRASLRLDTAALLIQGGDSGSSVVRGNSQDSLLVSMLTGESGVRMPPEAEGAALSDLQIALIKKWIDQGAPAPEEPTPADPRDHWSFRPPERPVVPRVTEQSLNTNPIDSFLAAAHESHGVTPVKRADKRTLLRRVYFDLIGLPPTPAEVAAFVTDDSPQAYENVFDRLLASPQYGERWARHWMDMWRYSDWAGYEQEVRHSARHIWRWRDWIIESLNADKGYDQMVREMLAGDELAPTDADVLSATGFLARNWYKFNRNTWLDNTVEHTAKAFLGITMNCCRCHDHKYDPISQVEYYQLRAVFEPHDVRTDRVPGEADITKDGLPRVYDMKPDEPTYLFERGNELRPDREHHLKPSVPLALGGALAIAPVEVPLFARYPALRDFAIAEDLAAAAHRVSECETALKKAQREVAATNGLAANLTFFGKELPLVRDIEQSTVIAADIAVKQLATARAEHTALAARIAAEKAKYGLGPRNEASQLAAAAAKAERERALCQAQEHKYLADAKLAFPSLELGLVDKATSDAHTSLEEEVTKANAALAAAHAALADAGVEYQQLGEAYPEKSTGRRLAFANWLTNRKNPLSARVAINHIWLHHFGAPLVDNMFDFGLRTPQARNQALLDWLAVELMESGWKMKHIHRLMVTSNAYRMQSDNMAVNETNLLIDRDNRLLWRMNARRLEAEAVRDALFYVAGTLDQTRGGPDIDCLAVADTPRRSIYFRHAYEKQMKFLEIFDSASTNECYRRSESIVPLQALALANSDVAIDQSRLLAQRLSKQAALENATDRAFVQLAYVQILNRDPSEMELGECLSFLKSQTDLLGTPEKLTTIVGGPKPRVAPSTEPAQRARENLTHVLFNHNDFVTIR